MLGVEIHVATLTAVPNRLLASTACLLNANIRMSHTKVLITPFKHINTHEIHLIIAPRHCFIRAISYTAALRWYKFIPPVRIWSPVATIPNLLTRIFSNINTLYYSIIPNLFVYRYAHLILFLVAILILLLHLFHLPPQHLDLSVFLSDHLVSIVRGSFGFRVDFIYAFLAII